MLADIGGVASIVYVISRALARRLSQNMLVTSLMKVMFRAKTLVEEKETDHDIEVPDAKL